MCKMDLLDLETYKRFNLSEWGSIASIIGLILAVFLAIFVANKIYHIYKVKIGKVDIDASKNKQENKSWFSLFNIQINKQDK